MVDSASRILCIQRFKHFKATQFKFDTIALSIVIVYSKFPPEIAHLTQVKMILDSSFSFITLALLISTSLAIPKPLPQAASPAAGDGPQSGGTQQLAGAAQQRQNLLNPPVSGNLQGELRRSSHHEHLSDSII